MSNVGLSVSKNSVYFNGEPIYFWSGEFPYYRMRSEEWGKRLDQIKKAGVLFITAYIPWNLHETTEGDFDFTGEKTDYRRNLVGFIKEIEKRDMYFIPKPGPFICAEVQHGAIPDWLTDRYPEIIMKNHKGDNVGFRQDQKPLPDFLHPTYLSYVNKYYSALCKDVLADLQYPNGPVVAIQVENELPYSTSELADPYAWGYSVQMIELYREWLQKDYGTVEEYNLVHQLDLKDFASILPPQPKETGDQELVHWLLEQDFCRFKAEYGIDVLKIYWQMLQDAGMHVIPYHNPGMLEDEAPLHFGALSDIMWIGINYWLFARPEHNLDAYTQGIRRIKQLEGGQLNRPAFAPELNWGWSSPSASDFLTRYTMPFLKGINIYCLVDGKDAGELGGKPYTNNPEPFPGSSPINGNGEETPAYETLCRLTAFTENEGATFAEATYHSNIGLGFYVPYNYPYLYKRWGQLTDEQVNQQLRNHIGANTFMQDMIKSFIIQNIDYHGLDIERTPLEVLAGKSALVVLSQTMMDPSTQEKLVAYVNMGGKLILLPEVPKTDLSLRVANPLESRLLAGLRITSQSVSTKTLKAFGKQYEAALYSSIEITDTNAWHAVAQTEEGQAAGVERTFGLGKVYYLGAYLTEGAFYKNLFDKERVAASHAYATDEDVEVIHLTNEKAQADYLFAIHRGDQDVKTKLHFVDSYRQTEVVLDVELGKKTVSILKVVGGRIESYSINGPEGTVHDSYKRKG